LLVACCLASLLSSCSWLTPDLAPVAVITATPATGKAPLVVRLSGSLSEDDAGILEYSWEFPDQDPAQMAGVQGEQSFEKSGDYIVRLTVTDSAGQSNATEVLIQVENTSPIASARFSNDAPIPGESVLFDASSSFDPDGQLIDFIWDFGDGETRRGTRVSHVYSQLGLYEVRLTVVDNAGALSTISHTMTVHTQSVGGGCGG
jgi:PKD repeat protein